MYINKIKTFYTKKKMQQSLPLSSWTTLPSPQNLKICTSSQNRFCNDTRTFDQNVSINHALVGEALPLTKIPPVICPPIAAFDYWSPSYVVPTGINNETNYDAHKAGYITEPASLECLLQSSSNQKEQFTLPSYNYVYSNNSLNSSSIVPERETTTPSTTQSSPAPTPGDVDTSCGYNQNQLLQYGLPSNLPAGACMKQPEMKDYNYNLFTTPIEPTSYNTTQVIEPVQSNLGISFQQQFEPLTKTIDPITGAIHYTSRDPRIPVPPVSAVPRPPIADASNVYDPRSNGYGPSYRSYIDPMSGRVRYIYNDIDAIRNPNYVVRSNIDNNPWAASYGPMNSNLLTDNRKLANQQYIDASSTQREELQERYMRKVNSEVMWQRRMAPIHTQSLQKGFKR